jgi:quinol-cytochrome oxidoreductase complex cytochrome b subunit
MRTDTKWRDALLLLVLVNSIVLAVVAFGKVPRPLHNGMLIVSIVASGITMVGILVVSVRALRSRARDTERGGTQ